jgi:hypothetical protein
MAKKATTAAFDIVDPPPDCLLGASFGVYGNCSQLTTDPGLTVTVTLTLTKLDGTEYMRPETATTNATAMTWEAFFPNIPASTPNSGKLIAHCSSDDTNTGPTELLTIATAIQAGLDVGFPINGDIVDEPLGPIPLAKKTAKKSAQKSVKVAVAAKKKGKGKYPESAFAVAYVTKGGERLKNTFTLLNPVSTSGGKSSWELNLDDLFDKQVTSGRYSLHYQVIDDASRHRVSRGSFEVKPK